MTDTTATKATATETTGAVTGGLRTMLRFGGTDRCLPG